MTRSRIAAGIVVASLLGTVIAAWRADGLTAMAVAAANAVVLAATALLVRREEDPEAPSAAASLDERLAALVEMSAEVVVLVDQTGRNLYISPSVERCLGWSAEEFDRFPADDLVHRDDLAALLDAYTLAQREAATRGEAEIRVRARAGWRWADVRVTNQVGDPAIGGYVVTLRDITAQRMHEDLLAARATQAGAIAHLGRRALEGADPSQLAREATEAVLTGLGVQRSALFRAVRGHDQLLLAAVAGDDRDAEPKGVPLDKTTLVWSAMVHPRAQCANPSGEIHDFAGDAMVGTALGVVVTGKERRYGVLTARASAARTFTADDVHFISSVANSLALAIERRGVEEEAHHRALHDPLTSLPNRVMFMDRLERALTDAKVTGRLTAVFFVDLDHFKQVNDTLGHAAGDAMLIGVADRLRETLRPGDLVARFGGDEFTVLCEHLTELAPAQRIAERIAASLEDPIDFAGRPLRVTASIGFVLSNPAVGGDQADSLIERADSAMYEAKGQGRNQIRHHDHSGPSSPISGLRSKDDLRDAVLDQRLTLVYQPVVELATGRVVGAEALVRWRHPERGMLPALEFIAASEDSGLIEDVGAWILETAIAQAVRWRRSGRSIVTSVNLSPRQLLRADFADTLAERLRRTGCEPGWLCLEIPEAAMSTDLAGTAAGMEAIRALGVLLAIDEFGTGHSSLNYLRRLPVDVVKIDRSLIQEAALPGAAQDRAVLGSLVSLARSLGLHVIAVGVETSEQAALVSHLGFEQAQGFLYSKPTPPESATALMQLDSAPTPSPAPDPAGVLAPSPT